MQFDNEITVPGCEENGHAGGHAGGDADFVLQADQVLHLLFCNMCVCICDIEKNFLNYIIILTTIESGAVG